MRNKKVSLKNKKGFTLSEILGVIVIIGMLLVVVTPSVLNRIRGSKDTAETAGNKIIYDAALQHISANKQDYPAGKRYCIKVKSLIDEGKLVSPVKDVTTGKTLDENFSILVSIYSAGNMYYEISEDEECKVMEALPLITFTVSPDGTTWVKQRTVTINYNDSDPSTRQYSLDEGKSWSSYSSPITLTQPATLYARETLNGTVNISKIDIKYIDSEEPKIINVSKKVNTKQLKIKVTDKGSGVNYYALGIGNLPGASDARWKKTPSIINSGTITTASGLSYQSTTSGNVSTTKVWVRDQVGLTATSSIDVVSITVPTTSLYCQNLTYNGSEQTLTKTPQSGSTFVNTKGTNAGEYTVTAKLSDDVLGDSYNKYYEWSDGTKGNKTFKCTIARLKTATTGSCQSRTYNGSSQTLASGGNFIFYSNNSRTLAGTQAVTVTADSNHLFSDGAATKTLSCTVERKAVAEPSCTARTYTGSSQTMLDAHAASASTTNGYSNDAITGTNAGNYEKTLTLDPNYKWSSGNNVTSNRTKTCTIARAKTATTGSCQSRTYNGSAQTLASGGNFISYSNNSKTDAGSQNVTVTANTNYAFSDGSTSKTLSCTINAAAPACTDSTWDCSYSSTPECSLNGSRFIYDCSYQTKARIVLCKSNCGKYKQNAASNGTKIDSGEASWICPGQTDAQVKSIGFTVVSSSSWSCSNYSAPSW